MAHETGWLIEGNGVYWDGRSLDSTSFVSDSLQAVRFSRQQDGERVRAWLLKQHSFALKVTEHIWLDGPSEKQPTAPYPHDKNGRKLTPGTRVAYGTIEPTVVTIVGEWIPDESVDHEWDAMVRIDGADGDESWCWSLTDPDFSATQWEVIP